MIVMLESGEIVNLFVLVKKIRILTILMVLLFYMLSLGNFFYFCRLRKELSICTYASADLRVEILNNRNGSYI